MEIAGSRLRRGQMSWLVTQLKHQKGQATLDLKEVDPS